MSIRVGRAYKFDDPKVEQAFSEVWDALQRQKIGVGNLDISGIASSLANTFKPGQVLVVNRIITGADECERLNIVGKATTVAQPVLYAYSSQVSSDPVAWIQSAYASALALYVVGESRFNGSGEVPTLLLEQTNGSSAEPALEIDYSGTGAIISEVGTGATLSNVGVWTDAPSSFSFKEDFYEFGDDEIIEKLKQLDVPSWRYIPGERRRGPPKRHMGPDVDAFSRIFELGDSNGIAPKDVASVALRACKALIGKVEQLDGRLAAVEGQ